MTSTLTDDEVNEGAAFLPKTNDDELPAIQVAGVTVFLYRKDGVMRVSVDLDDAGETTPTVDPDGERRVPIQITVQGQTVWEAH